MSALLYTLVRRRTLLIIFLGSFVFSLFLPLFVFASADALPPGVLERQKCGSFSVDIFGYGAGMIQNPGLIQTMNQRVSFISPTENCAVVQWESNTPATSQVLFAELSAEPVTIVVSADNFGYPRATTQNNAGTSLHTAILTGLEPGKAYSYRLVTRSHPTAMPSISDPQVLIAGPLITSAGSATPSTSVAPTPVVPIPAPRFDAEKFPITPIVAPPTTKATPTTEVLGEGTTVPAAVTAAEEALGASRERDFWSRIKAFLLGLMPDKDRLSLSSNLGLFERDRYIIPTLFFLGILFLLQQLVLPTLGMTLRSPLLYWLFGTVILAVLSAVFMFYYITLMAVALFLGLLAWYLLKNVPEDDEETAIQPKLLETAEKKKKVKKKEYT